MKPSVKRVTIYLEPKLHRALRLKAVHSDSSISELVNDAVKQSFTEDAIDLAAFEKTKREKSLNYSDVVVKLRARGKL